MAKSWRQNPYFYLGLVVAAGIASGTVSGIVSTYLTNKLGFVQPTVAVTAESLVKNPSIAADAINIAKNLHSVSKGNGENFLVV